MYARFRIPTLSALVLVLAAAACESPTDPIRLHVHHATIEAVGDAVQLEATVHNSDLLPEWESLNPEIVTVTSAGRAVAVAPGTATVRARIGSRVSGGTVTVLPSVEVQITSLTVSTDVSGQPRAHIQLRNVGGRGYYKVEYWQERESPGGEHRRVLAQDTDHAAPVGMDFGSGGSSVIPDWAIVYSRDPHSTQYRMTGCRRVDGGTPCPMP